MEPLHSPGRLQPGETLEFWARKCEDDGAPYLTVTSDRGVEYEVRDLPAYFDFFHYTNRTAAAVELRCRTTGWEVSFAYRWHPESLPIEGIQPVSMTPVTHDAASNPARPQLHFSPLMQWMNDPNGLCYIDGVYHLFYQFHPNSTQWGPMHWGHATSRDLFNWVHYPVFLHPRQNLPALGATGGAFSGTACTEIPGAPVFFYTERLPAYDLYEDYTEIQKRVVADSTLVEPVTVETVLADKPEGVGCDFRDPKVWYDASCHAYFMILGAALHGDPAVLLYRSPDSRDWSFQGALYVAPSHFRENGARCIECPDFFKLDGQWVLYMGFVGYQEPDTGRHNLMYYLTGDFSADQGFSPRSELKELDFGSDFYAMQSFEAEGRRLAFAWLFNWAFQKPEGPDYSGEMSIPRQLSLNGQGELCMHPIISGLKSETLPYSPSLPMTWFPGERAFQVRLMANGQPIRRLSIEGADRLGNVFAIEFGDGQLAMRTPEDGDGVRYCRAVSVLHDLTLIYDAGVVEVFANQGAVCGTRRTYAISKISQLRTELDDSSGRVEVIAETLQLNR